MTPAVVRGPDGPRTTGTGWPTGSPPDNAPTINHTRLTEPITVVPPGHGGKEKVMSTMSSTALKAHVAVPALVWAVAAIALFGAYFLVQENGALLSANAATFLHEVTHDGRHALGVPCH